MNAGYLAHRLHIWHRALFSSRRIDSLAMSYREEVKIESYSWSLYSTRQAVLFGCSSN